MPKHFLYSVQMLIPNYEHPVKIGCSCSPQFRQWNYTRGPYPTKWLGAWPAKGGFAEERAIHAKFSAFRLTGEWFKPDRSLLRFVLKQIAQYEELKTTVTEDEAYDQFKARVRLPRKPPVRTHRKKMPPFIPKKHQPRVRRFINPYEGMTPDEFWGDLPRKGPRKRAPRRKIEVTSVDTD